MKKKLILFMPTIDIGGVEKNFFLISNYLSTKLENISVITTSFTKKKQFSKKINFISLQNKFYDKLSRRLKFLLALILLLVELIKNTNCTVFSFQANIYCIYLCKLMNTKVIVRSNSSPTGWSKNIIKKIIYKNALSIADKVIVNSHEFKKLIKSKFNVNSVCIYNPLNKNEIIKKSKIKINLSFFQKNTLNFVNVARFEDQKDHRTLLKAFWKLKNKIDYRLLLVGSGSKEKFIKDFIQSKKLTNKIKIIKNISNPFPYILKSKYFVLASKYEGLPNVLLEAITLKKYIISSDCPTGPKEILNNGKYGTLFKSGNSDDLCKKLISISKKKQNLNKKILMANKGLERFNYKKNLNNYLKLILPFLNN